MDFRLQNKDLVCSQGGTPDTVTGVEELLQRVMIRLCVPRGRFAYNTQLGSRWEDLTVEQAQPQELLAHPATDFVRKLTEQQRRTCHLPDNRLNDCEYSGMGCLTKK